MAIRIFSRWCRRLAWGFLFFVAGIAALSRSAEPEELSDEEARQMQIAERFLDILLNNPRRGTALDRVYGHHVESGTLDTFLEQLDQRLQSNPQDGADWMLMGPAGRLTPVERGMNVFLRNAEGFVTWLGLVRRRTIAGDCDATVSSSGLDIQPVKTGWDVAFGLTITLDDP